MDAVNSIYHRRAIRDFKTAEPTHEEINALIDAAIQAPSGVNRQPWSFFVVTGRDLLERCSTAAKAHLLGALTGQPLLEGFRGHLTSPEFNIFYNAPVLLIICATDPDLMSLKDCCLAAQNLMLAAHDRGMGACWIGFSEAWLNSPGGKAALGIPESFTPVAPIILGTPASRPDRPHRNPPDIHWVNRIGCPGD